MRFAELFNALPDGDKEDVLYRLHQALMYRSGNNGLRDMSRIYWLEQIAAVFAKHGFGIEEYT